MLVKRTLTSFFHTCLPSTFPTPRLAARWGSAFDKLFYLLTFAKAWSPKPCSNLSSPLVAELYQEQRRLAQRTKSFLPAFAITVTWYQLQPLTTSSDAFIKKHRWVSKGSRLVWIRHEGVARHFFPKLSDHSHSGVASYTGARCKLRWDNPLHLICKVYWLWVCPQGSWVVLC